MEKTESDKQSKMMAMLSCFSIFIVIISFSAGMIGSYLGTMVFTGEIDTGDSGASTTVQIEEDSSVIDVVEQHQDSVVSIVISRELTERQIRFREQFGYTNPGNLELGSGSGFIIDSNGLIVTNRHVVGEQDSEYTVIFNDGQQVPAEVLARDSVLDIAVVKVDATDMNLEPVTLGNSDSIQIGQRAIAIGNSLGEFSNTVSLGIISGLSRNIIASDQSGSSSELLEDVIQTDASINPGNSGGPLFDILGNVIGVNVAVAQDAENVGFAIPINSVKRIINDVTEYGEIRRPYLGVRFITVNETVQEEEGLTEDYGALVIEGDNGESGIIEDSPAEAAGIEVGDHILSVNGTNLDQENPLHKVIQKLEVGDQIEMEIIREGEEITITAVLEKSVF